MIHLRLVVPAADSTELIEFLRVDPRVTHVVVMPGAAIAPAGDAVFCDVAREAASDVIESLKAIVSSGEVSIAMEETHATSSSSATAAEAAAPGAGDDGIVWDIVLGRAIADTERSWSFYAFLVLATMIAAIAVVLDSSILVVGAMVVGPEFGPVAAIAVGLALRRPALIGNALRLLILGFAVAIVATAALALVGDLAGWISRDDLLRDRPLTGFIWKPDRWSFVVALLAGTAGVLSLTAGRSSALVGVFISVTTVPAAGNLALAIALREPDEIGGAAGQLAINLTGMVLAGTALLTLQRLLTRRGGATAAVSGI